jgi:hypothetical protein
MRNGHAKLLLTIETDTGVQEYWVKPVNDGSRSFWLIKKEDDEKAYRVSATGCDCQDMRQRRPAGGCKHVKAAKAVGLL